MLRRGLFDFELLGLTGPGSYWTCTTTITTEQYILPLDGDVDVDVHVESRAS